MEYTNEQLTRINDHLRRLLCTGYCNINFEGINGRLLVTRNVADLSAERQMMLLFSVGRFNSFTEDNDPHGEHDFGFIDLFGERWFWKFDYYDKDMEGYGHDNHVLTIMNADDY